MTISLEATTRQQPFAGDLRTDEADAPLFGTPFVDGVAGTSILVAEDDPTCRRALQHYLGRLGYRVAEAATVESTLEALAGHADLVVVDLDRDGSTADVVAEIRRDSSVPVIVCSGRASERDRVNLFNLGADDFLTKPYSFGELEARIRAVPHLPRRSYTETSSSTRGRAPCGSTSARSR
jgi:DNA-binding response OmpR family regulator